MTPRTEEHNKNYSNPDNDPNGLWRSGDVRSPNLRDKLKYEVQTPAGNIIEPPEKGWRWSEELFWEKFNTGEITFVNNSTKVLRKIYLKDQKGRVPESIWFGNDVGTTREANKELKELWNKLFFDTPKPEKLVQRVLTLSTNPGDLVLDSFLGSGTTAAVAHKMGRRYIGIEMGEHAKTHCAARLQKVVEGEQGGISTAVGWQGGGGFRFFELGEQVYDADGHICDGISFANLAAHIWFCETERAWRKPDELTTCLGATEETAYSLLYNGVLGDRRPQGGNVLTAKTLDIIRADLAAAYPDFDGQLVIYGESSRLSAQRLEREKVIFKQTPYDVRGA